MKAHGSFASLILFCSENLFVEAIGSKTEDLYKNLPCLVCGGFATGIHFGAVTCEACKVRYIKEYKTF